MFDLASWLLGLGVILGLMLAAWLISLLLRNASIVDSLWSLLFVAALGAYMANAGQTGGRTVVIIALVLVWAVRLAGYITWRNWGEGEDRRYQEFRRNAGDSFWIRSLFTVFLLQGFLAWVVSLPLLAAVDPQPSLGILDVVGIGVWMVGFVFEAGGDLQLARFKADAANQGRVLDSGWWRYTRHPNYFGDSHAMVGFLSHWAGGRRVVGTPWTGPDDLSAHPSVGSAAPRAGPGYETTGVCGLCPSN